MTPEQILDERFFLSYRADYSSRYHRRRASFLSKFDTISNIVTMLAGTGVFVSLMQGGPVFFAQAAGLTISALAIVQVVVGIGPLGARHAEWMRGWDKLANDIRAVPIPTEEDLRDWNDRRAEIEGECVNELRALCYDCENQTRTHWGLTEGIVRIEWWQRAIIQLGTFQSDFPVVTGPSPLPSRADAETGTGE